MYQDVDQVEKQIFDATDAVSDRREVLQGQGLVQADDMQQAVEQARLREAQVRQNPNSTDEDISAAKEERKNAEVALALNDPEMQRRIVTVLMVMIPRLMEGEWTDESAAKDAGETAARAAALKPSTRKSRRSGLAGPKVLVLLMGDSLSVG
ncbi:MULTISPECIES: hypothetical protein [Pseudomonas]|uniref:Uncharacterized protein n=1 Tax=Pseudomonas weihenstephanensis TaxID=1608994 RepID=A0ABS1ZNM7_9PSED|nr:MULTISPECIES: hypothetical protein [Pseudomonas]MBM1198091.1 hypothetical protein [Pseudomonas weihenstephanensis]NNA00343.1 hypothetical protein [Pseudomonas lundensis]